MQKFSSAFFLAFASVLLLFGLSVDPLHAKQQLSSIHSVAVVSLLGNEVDMQTIGLTKFDYKDYKLHTTGKLDDDVRDLISNALKGRLAIKNDINSPVFSGIKSSFTETLSDNIGTHIRSMSPAPDLDAVIVVYPNATDIYVATQLEVTYEPSFLFRDPLTTIAAAYVVGIFDAKTGERIDYGTGRLPDRGYISGYSPPWERCSNSLWAESEAELTIDQKAKIQQELWSLITRSLPYALSSAGLIGASETAALVASAAPAADPSCHAPF